MVEGTGHTVFSSDGRQSESQLCAVSTEEGCEGLAPAMGILGHSAEVLLEGETDLAVITTSCHDSCHRLQHCVNSTMIRRPAGQIGIKSITHHGNGIRISFEYRKFGYHCLGLGQLIFSAIRHQYAACSDGAVEHLHQTLLGANI